MGSSTQHAVLSPSAAKRWLTCTPSARLEEQFPSSDTAATIEGTRAHLWAEYAVCNRLNLPWDKSLSDLFPDDDMRMYGENYAEFVANLFAMAKNITPDAEIHTENALNLSTYIPEGFGTADVIIIADQTLYVVDYKYGKGVPVYAERNPQMMIYALGALDLYSMMYNIKEVSVSIYQPRICNITSWDISVDELLGWATAELTPKAQMAFNGEGEQVTGDHCKFCRASGVCRQQMKESFEIVDTLSSKGDTALLSVDEMAQVLDRADQISAWIKSVEALALNVAMNGQNVPGYKVVEGRSVRQYTDADKVAEVLIDNGYDKALIYQAPALLGITDMEKILKKSTFSKLLGDLVVKPKGKPTLVLESDKREPYAADVTESARQDFETN